MLVNPQLVELPEVVGRERSAAVGALHLPWSVRNVDNPGIQPVLVRQIRVAMAAVVHFRIVAIADDSTARQLLRCDIRA